MNISVIIPIDNEALARVLFDLVCPDFDSISSFFGGALLPKALNFL